MKLTRAALALTAWVSSAHAADTVLYGPPPPWVQAPAALPKLPPPDSFPVRIVRLDKQARVEADGDTTYVDNVFQPQNADGLAQLGTVTLPWNPATETLTVHRLDILRGGKVVASFAKPGAFIVLRRETNLESATLDGELTAAIELPGLQAGDLVDAAYSYRRADPAFMDLHTVALEAPVDTPVIQASLRMAWPQSMKLRWQGSSELAAAKQAEAGGTVSVAWAGANLLPPPQPTDAPPRFRRERTLELTSLPDWPSLSRRMQPLYAHAASLAPGSPLAAQIAALRTAFADPAARGGGAAAGAVRVRYVALAYGEGGQIPADADLTWQRRFGDCKGKTVLLMALLRGLGIDAVPVVVSTENGDALPQHLPRLGAFDHVLVRATIGGTEYWLDGTRTGDTTLASLPVPDYSWGLPLTGAGTALTRIAPRPETVPESDFNVTIDARGGLDTAAPIKATADYAGDEAQRTRSDFASETPDAIDRDLRRFWMRQFDDLTVTGTGFAYDPVTGAAHASMTGTIKLSWKNDHYQADGMDLGYDAHFDRPAGEDQTLPYQVDFPSYSRYRETILLPDNGAGFSVGSDEVNGVVAGVEYYRHGALHGGTFVAEVHERAVAPEFPASEAMSAQAKLRDMNGKTVNLYRPQADAAQSAPAESGGQSDWDRLVAAGDKALASKQYADAVSDYTKAAAAAPDDRHAGLALLGCSWSHVHLHNFAAAQEDLAKAAKLDPGDNKVIHAEAELAALRGDFPAAVKSLDLFLGRDPSNTGALLWRARLQFDLHAYDAVLADTAKVKQIDKTIDQAYILRASVFHAEGNARAADAEAEDVIAAKNSSRDAFLIGARIYFANGNRVKAIDCIDRATAMKDDATVHLMRADIRPYSDFSGKLADLAAAKKVGPVAQTYWIGLARTEFQAGKPEDALNDVNAGIKAFGETFDFLSIRGAILAKLGRAQPALADFTQARAVAGSSAGLLNDLCYAEATSNVGLADALKDCQTSMEWGERSAPVLDSTGFTLMRLGRYAESIGYFTRALALRPTQAASLYGRACAEKRLGKHAAAAADAAAAVKADPDIGAEFAGYGVSL